MPLTNTIPLKLSTSTNISRFVSGEGVGLAFGGTGVDLSASGGSTFVLAQDASHVISARALVAADIPSLDAAKITTGQITLARGGTSADLSATGGTSKFLKQASVGGSVTVVQPTLADLAAGTLGVDLTMTGRIQFTGAGTVDTTKTLIHADAANGNMRVQVPSTKSIATWVSTFQAFAIDGGGIYPGKGIIFSNSAGVANSAQTQIYADAAAGNLLINVPSAKYFGLLVAGFTSYTFGYSANLATTGANVFQIGDGSGSYIQSDGFGLLHRVSNTYAHTFKVNTTDVGYFDGSGLTVTKNIVSSNNSNAGDRTTNLDVQRYFNNIFWGWPASAYTCSVGSFNGSGYPFICFYGYHSTTTNTIKRSSASNQPVWLQSLSGYLSIWQGSSGTADVNCTGTEKYRFDDIFQTDRASLGTTMGSPNDPGSGGLSLTGNMVSTNNSNTGNRTANIDVQRYFNNIFWGWPNSAYTCSVGSFNGSGYPFICFYGYHSATTNTIKRSSASNQPVWLQSLGGYLSIWQGSSGTADTDCTSTEKYRFDDIFQTNRLSIGTTIGSPTDPGSGGIYTSGNVNVAGTITLSGSTPWINTLASGTGVYLQMGAGSANISTIITYTNAYDGGTKRGSMELLAGQVAGASIRVYDKDSNQQLDISEAGCVSVRQNSGGRTANFSALKHFNSYFWGHTNTEYLSTIGAFNSGGQPFIAFYAYHSTTTNTLARASATNVATWLQADTTGYISFFQGNTGTVDGNITGTEKYRFGASLLETSAASFGGTIGSSSNPGAGGIYATGNVNFRGGQKAGVSIKTTTYTATVNDYILLGNHATTAFTINLPAATGSCQVLVIGNINAAVVTVDANGTETIAGALTQTLNQWDSIMICDYGTGTWNILARK